MIRPRSARVTRVGDAGASAWIELEAEGARGVGEACPLPGRSLETADACATALERAATSLGSLDADDPCPVAAVERALGPVVDDLAPLPAARFALETALLDLLARVRGVSLAEALGGGRVYDSVALNALLAVDPDASPRALADAGLRAVAEGYRALKIKLGPAASRDPRAFERALASLRALRAALPDVELRVDVNGAWSVADARARLAALAEVAPRYVEQPVAPGSLEALGPTAVPWAADESLAVPGAAERLVGLQGCAAFVLKPTFLGLLDARRLAELAHARGVGVVVTHAFEGPIALAAACELALSFARPPLASGLAPHARLAAYPSVAVPQLATPGVARASGAPGLGVSVG